MKTLFLFCLLLLVILLLFRAFENHFVFFPQKFPAGYWQPETFGLKLEDCYFHTEDGSKLHGWFMKAEDARATILWSHGNAGNISNRLDNLVKLAALPFNVFIYDYRGYGKSAGKPTEQGVYQDAVAAYNYMLARPDVDPEKIVIYGRSLGGVVALDLATKKPARCVILESTFTSARDMARIQFGPIPVQWLMTVEMASVEKIRKITAPILVLHGDRDGIVPYDLGRKLFEAAPEPKEFYRIEGADHNDTYLVGGQAYFNKIKEFILNNL